MTENDLKSAIKAVAGAKGVAQLEKLRLKYLGRKGELTEALSGIGKLPAGKRAAAGKFLNQARASLEAAITKRGQALAKASLSTEAEQPLDLTAPVKKLSLGHYHPIKQLEKELVQIFWQLGFAVAEGPEIENDWYNFEALNVPADHPARDMHDTFYLENGAIPRTHTSPVQVRYMESHKPPIRIIAPGNAYRNEDEDATHLWAHKQIEGLVVDEGITLSDLKGTLEYMLKALLGESAQLKLLPNYFPFTEPSMEVHVSCVFCSGKDPQCFTCRGVGWIELGGCGMVHSQVLRNVDIDPTKYSGFAFGFGIDRMTAIRHQIPDARLLWRPDLRFLEQF